MARGFLTSCELAGAARPRLSATSGSHHCPMGGTGDGSPSFQGNRMKGCQWQSARRREDFESGSAETLLLRELPPRVAECVGYGDARLRDALALCADEAHRDPFKSACFGRITFQKRCD